MTGVEKAVRLAYDRSKKKSNGRNLPSPSAAPEWGELIPLAAAPEVPAFPVEVLPAPLAQFVAEVAASIPCPMDYVGVPLLALVGAAIGASRALEIKDGWTERPALYAAVVCPPSAGKSPAQKIVANPYYHEQTRLHELYSRERRAYEDGVDGALKPVERALYVDDITTEKLAHVLRENPRGVAIIKDELTAWVRGMDAYRSGKGADKQFWLSAWAGSPISVHRKIQDNGPVRVAHPFVAIVGGLPPDLLTTLRGERAVSDGFMDRILFTFPEPFPAQGENWRCVADEYRDAWRIALARLWELQQEEEPERGPRPHFVHLSSCGRKAWERFTTDLANEMNRHDFQDCLRGPWGKLKGYGARLALIIHQLRMVHDDANDENVDGKSIDRAAQLVSYFQGHARKVYAMIDADPKVADARRVVRWFVDGRLERFTKRDAYQALKGTFKTVEDLQPILTLLERHGYIRAASASDRAGPGRKPSPVYEVHPDAFAEGGE